MAERCSKKVRAKKKKKKLKDLDFLSISINSAAFINDSLCRYYKNLQENCKNLWLNKFIHGFWAAKRSIRLKIRKTGNVHVISHDISEQFFPGNELVSDDMH